MNTRVMNWVGRTSVWTGAAVAYVAMADWLFYRHPAGWTYGLYTAVLLAAVLVRMRSKRLRSLPVLVVAATVLALAAAMVIEPSVWAVLLAILGLVMLGITGRQGWRSDAGVWAERWVHFMVKWYQQPFRDARVARMWARSHSIRRWFWVTFVRNWRLPVLLSMVFVVMFALANPVVARWLNDFWELLKKLPELPKPGRIVMWAVAGGAFWALLRTRVKDRAHAPVVDPAPRNEAGELPLFVVRCLVVFNIVFAVENALDICYLWGGAALPDGITYAAYAHRGAYPLIVTALLAAAFVLVTFRPEGRTQRYTLARKLGYLWIGQNVLLTGSSIWRLRLYVDVYSLTRWRIAAAVWMLLVAFGLVWIAARIVLGRSNRWLVNTNALTTAALLFLCTFANFDGMISSYNVRHCSEVTGRGVPIDLQYLNDLGPEAIPGIEWLGRKLGNSPKGQRARDIAAGMKKSLSRDLADWRGWTVLRSRIMNATLIDG